jgi:hypothetical protein
MKPTPTGPGNAIHRHEADRLRELSRPERLVRRAGFVLRRGAIVAGKSVPIRFNLNAPSAGHDALASVELSGVSHRSMALLGLLHGLLVDG